MCRVLQERQGGGKGNPASCHTLHKTQDNDLTSESLLLCSQMANAKTSEPDFVGSNPNSSPA